MMSRESYVLVVTETAVEGKRKIIESILDKLVPTVAMVTVPIEYQSDVVRTWCKDNDRTFSVLEDEGGNYAEWCDFGIFFTGGPTKESFLDKHRQSFVVFNKIAIVVEVNVESASKV